MAIDDPAPLPHGREKDPDPDDPMSLQGVGGLPGDPALMARCIVEEYARMGATRDAILALFTDPEFHTHRLLVEHGEEWVRRIVDETLARIGTFRFVEVVEDDPVRCPSATGRPLPMIQDERQP